MPGSILIYVPTVRLFGRALQSIMRLQWPGKVDVVFARGGDATEAMSKQGKFKVVTAKYNHGRDMLLAGDYDAIATIEDDMIVPPDALIKLWDTGADIAYGLYCWRHQGFHKWSAYTEIGDRHGVALSDDPEAAKAAWGSVIEVQGIGNGCTLIRRHVLEAMPFRKHRKACCDWGLAYDAQRRGYRQACDLSVVCGHMAIDNEQHKGFPIVYGQWGPPRIIWPDPDLDNTGKLYRVEYL